MEAQHKQLPDLHQPVIDQITASRIAATCKRYRSLAIRCRTLLNRARDVHHRDGYCLIPR